MNATEHYSSFDEDALLQSVDGDRALLREIVRLFSEVDCPRLVILLNQGLTQRHARTVYEAGHALKGLCGEMRAGYAQSLALEIERAGEAGNFDGLDSQVLQLIAETETLKNNLRSFADALPA